MDSPAQGNALGWQRHKTNPALKGQNSGSVIQQTADTVACSLFIGKMVELCARSWKMH